MDFSSSPTLPAVGAVLPNPQPITSVSYHEDGKRLYVASEGNATLQVVDCMTGKRCDTENAQYRHPLRTEREQIHVVEATHHEDAVLIAGKGSQTQLVGQRNAISYWSLYDNKIVRKFRGHSDKVNSISMCPADDTFLSSSSDGTVRLWNLQQAGCLAELKLPERSGENLVNKSVPPTAVFDSTGLVFSVTAAMQNSAGHFVHLYDARNYSAGAFCELKVSQPDLANAIVQTATTIGASSLDSSRADEISKHATIESLEFNLSGSRILARATYGMTMVLDGFEGTIQRVHIDPSLGLSSADSATDAATTRAVACFVPSDDTTVLSANINQGTLTAWDVPTGNLVKGLDNPKHPGPITCLAANPKHAQFTSCCSQTALWIW